MLNSASQAERASSGVATGGCGQIEGFRGGVERAGIAASFDGIRAGIGWTHSKRAEVSKNGTGCRRAGACRTCAGRSNPMSSRSMTRSPQCLQRKTTALVLVDPGRGRPPRRAGGLGPNGPLARGSESDCWVSAVAVLAIFAHGRNPIHNHLRHGRRSRRRSRLWREGTTRLLGVSSMRIGCFTRSLETQPTARRIRVRGWAYPSPAGPRRPRGVSQGDRTDPSFGNPYNDIGCDLRRRAMGEAIPGSSAPRRLPLRAEHART